MTCPFSRQDGAYLLGALSPPERRGYEEHLADCPICSAALSEVAGLPGLLARLPVEAVEPTINPPPTGLLPSLLQAVESERRRSRRRVQIGAGLAAAAALVVVALLGTAIVTADDPSPTTTTAAPAPVAMTRVADIPIRATVALIDKPWGTEVDLRCTYSGKLDGKRDWVLVAIGRNGKSEQIAVWGVVAYGEAKVIGSTSFRSADLAALEVRGMSGTTLMRLRR